MIQVYSDIDKEYNALKYMRDIIDDATHYYSVVILNVFDAVAKNIGVDNPDSLAPGPPRALIKGFLDGLKDIKKNIKLKILSFMPEKLVLKKIKMMKKMTEEEWQEFNRQVQEYMSRYGRKIGESMAVKSVLLALAAAEEEKKRQNPEDYGRKSYMQMEDEYYDGRVPETVKEARTRGYTNRTIERAINERKDNIAIYVQKVNDNVRNAIREKVIQAVREGKTAKELASDLYWMKKEDPKFKKVDKNTAQMLIRDWHRVAVTEMMYAHSEGKMLAYEEQAKKSIEDPRHAVYYVFTGGTCDWCVPHHGVIVRHVPKDVVVDETNDSLSSMGIHDEYTDTAVWLGKNNVGYKKSAWRVCTPAHPYNTAVLARIYPDAQEYNEKTGRIEFKSSIKESLLPEDIEKRQREIEKKREQYLKRKS